MAFNPLDVGVPFVHPYIPNSAPEVREKMLKTIGVEKVADLYEEIPEKARFHEKLPIPDAKLSEYDVRKHVEGIMDKNISTKEAISFLGAGTWNHYVPAVVDSMANRGEFVTAYVGHEYSDAGKFQSHFEASSMIAELVNKNACSGSVWDWTTAFGSAILMAVHITGRKEVLLPAVLHPDKKLLVKNFGHTICDYTYFNYDEKTGKVDLADLKSKLSDKVATVVFENPNFFGVIEDQAEEIVRAAHEVGALVQVGVNPISLGILTPPGDYGADLVTGELQPLGKHQNFGGGTCGFIATDHDEKFLSQLPTVNHGIVGTPDGEYAFFWTRWGETSYVKREKATDYTGTSMTLWLDMTGVYLALLGPQGLKETDENIIARTQYTIRKLQGVKGLKLKFTGTSFNEFVVDFNGTGKSVADVNKALLAEGIFGGFDLSKNFPELGQCAMYCVTEVISKENIDKLADVLGEVVK